MVLIRFKTILTYVILLGFISSRATANDDISRPVSNSIPQADTHRAFLRDAAPYSLILAGGGILFALDKEIKKESLRSSLRGHEVDRFFHTAEHYGRIGPTLIAIPILAIHAIIFKENKSLYVAGELGGGSFVTGVATAIVKSSFGRLRPYQSNSPYEFFDGGSSFYSGHTITAFTTSTIIAKNFPSQNLGIIGINRDIPLVPIVAYTAAGLTGLQRIYSNNHWASDVYIGALAGYCIGTITVRVGEKIRAGKIHLPFHLAWNGIPMLVYSIDFN
jgi:membrane-associated phospholipid phosphatase